MRTHLVVEGGPGLMLWCPGCRVLHGVAVGPGEWTWNADTATPTISPSILTRFRDEAGEQMCHAFVRSGQWQFLTDCTHDLAGRTVPMVDVPEAFRS